MKVWSNITIVRLSFHTWKHGEIRLDGGPGAAVEGRWAAGPGGVTSLVSYTFEKEFGSAAGRVRLQLKSYAEGCTFIPVGSASQPARNGDPWVDLLDQGDWWELQIIRNGQLLQVGGGVIDEIFLELNEASGAITRVATVGGRDIGFGLEDVPVYFNPHDPLADNALGINMLTIIDSQVGRSDQLIRNMIEGMFGLKNSTTLLGSHIQVPPSLRRSKLITPTLAERDPNATLGRVEYWIDLMDLRTHMQETRGETFVAQSVLQADNQSQSVWAFITAWQNPVLNELYVDINPFEAALRGYVVLRERPFVNAIDEYGQWNAVPTAVVEAGTLTGASLSKGQNRINHVLLVGDLTGVIGSDAFGLHPPAVNFTSVERYGLRRLMETTSFFEDVGAGAAERQLRDWRTLVTSWNAINHRYQQGTITIAEARPDIRIGMKLALVDGPLGKYTAFPVAKPIQPGDVPDDALTFYVEGVRYMGQFGPEPMHRTEVTVSRGYQENRRLVDMLREYSLFQEESSVALGVVGSANIRSLVSQMSDSQLINYNRQQRIAHLAPSEGQT